MHHTHVEHRDGEPPHKCWLHPTEHAAQGHRMGLVHPEREGWRKEGGGGRMEGGRREWEEGVGAVLSYSFWRTYIAHVQWVNLHSI